MARRVNQVVGGRGLVDYVTFRGISRLTAATPTAINNVFETRKTNDLENLENKKDYKTSLYASEDYYNGNRRLSSFYQSSFISNPINITNQDSHCPTTSCYRPTLQREHFQTSACHWGASRQTASGPILMKNDNLTNAKAVCSTGYGKSNHFTYQSDSNSFEMDHRPIRTVPEQAIGLLLSAKNGPSRLAMPATDDVTTEVSTSYGDYGSIIVNDKGFYSMSASSGSDEIHTDNSDVRDVPYLSESPLSSPDGETLTPCVVDNNFVQNVDAPAVWRPW